MLDEMHHILDMSYNWSTNLIWAVGRQGELTERAIIGSGHKHT